MASKFSSKQFGLYFFLGAFLFMGSGVLFAYSFFTYGAVMAALGILSSIKIWRLYQQTNRSIAFFFDSIRNNDTTLVFPTTVKNSALDLLHNSLNNMNQHIQNVKLQAEIREKYFTSIIKQSATGFIVMNSESGIELINEAASALAGIPAESANPNLLKIKNNRLFTTLCSMKAGENTTFKNYKKYAVQQILLKATEIRTGARILMLFSMQDIRTELSEKEIESYQNLISILTHEIMNSLAPLTSISKTLNNMFQKELLVNGHLSDVQISTAIQGLQAIEDQSKGLLNFISNYRKLIKIPPPQIREIDVQDWIQQLYVLYSEICREKDILFEIKGEKVDVVEGDKNLLNQVLINLIQNAIDAFEGVEYEKRLQIVFSRDMGNFYIQVGNNGPVIPSELVEKIFVPFFTTKQNGSGIGLSISGQIVKLHKGVLDVFSDEVVGTIFTIKL